MSGSVELIESSVNAFTRAIEREDWEQADRNLQYLASQSLPRAIASQDQEAMSALGKAIPLLRMRMMTQFDVEQTPGPVMLAWQLAGLSAVTHAIKAPSTEAGASPSARPSV